jgi:hypothetical protein
MERQINGPHATAPGDARARKYAAEGDAAAGSPAAASQEEDEVCPRDEEKEDADEEHRGRSGAGSRWPEGRDADARHERDDAPGWVRRMNEREIDKHHADVRQAANAVRGDEKKLLDARDRTLDRAERREWAAKRFVVGGEYRWQETIDESPRYGRRRFVYDPTTDQVKEIL